MDRNNLVLGCDIGNGFGYVSLLQDPNSDPMPLFPKKYQLNHMGMPATAYITPPEGQPIVVFSRGKSAEKQFSRKPGQFVRAVKTRLKEGSILVPEVSAAVDTDKIYSAIARDLIALANEELANKSIDPVYDIVFTFPAAFSDDTNLLERMQRSISVIDFNGSKVNVIGRLPEPAAVAIDYLHYMQHIAPEDIRITGDKFTVLVYDLGHGTFDTAVVTARSKGQPYQLHAKAGLPEVGGKNFDEILYTEFCRILKDQYGYAPKNDRDRERIRSAAVSAKLELSDNPSSVQPIQAGEDYLEVEITQQRFEDLSQHLIFQTLELVQNVLDDATASGIQIDAIVLSGGSSKMPMVKNNLEILAEGALPVVLYRPSEAVSYGAARYAYGIAQNRTTPSTGGDSQKGTAASGKQTGGGSSNAILEQFTDCCYGIWVPSQTDLAGAVQFLVGCGQRRPFTSQPLRFYTSTGRVVIRLYRYGVPSRNPEVAPVSECESIMRFPFDIAPGAAYDVSITVQEDYSIQVTLRTDSGAVVQKSTSDLIANLV